MREQRTKIALKNQDTYIYIDVSNIRSACLKTLGFMVDFVKLLEYFERKYPNLKDVRYYEGIATDDIKKRRMFSFLGRKGYTICPLERKTYSLVETFTEEVRCPKCNYKWAAEFNKERKALKSNVDVYLASDMLIQAAQADYPTRFILVSCDGDYVEAIKNMINFNENVSVSVLATPYVNDFNKNTCSVRLRKLCNELKMSRYMIQDISNILSQIKSDRV